MANATTRTHTVVLSEQQFGTQLYEQLLSIPDEVIGTLLIRILLGIYPTTPESKTSESKQVPIVIPTIIPTTTTQTSSGIGASGEQHVREILQREYSVETVSNRPYSGDITIFRPRKYGAGSVNIMVEVKNYRNVVPTHEVEKFQRDAAVMPNIHAAMMISLGSPIAGHTSLDISDLSHGRTLPMMYLQSNSEDVILGAMRLLHLHVDQFRSIQNYLEQYNEHLYPKIWKGATKALELLQGIAQTRVLLLELRTQTCQKIDKIQERILINETQLNETLGKLRQRVSEFVPDSLSGGQQVRSEELWDCIGRMVHEHADGSAYDRYEANAVMTRTRAATGPKIPAGNLQVQLHGRMLVVSQGVPIFRLKLMVDSTELSYIPVLAEDGVHVGITQTYDGNWLSERIGKKGGLLHPRAHVLKPPTVGAEWKPGDLVEDMLDSTMTPD